MRFIGLFVFTLISTSCFATYSYIGFDAGYGSVVELDAQEFALLNHVKFGIIEPSKHTDWDAGFEAEVATSPTIYGLNRRANHHLEYLGVNFFRTGQYAINQDWNTIIKAGVHYHRYELKDHNNQELQNESSFMPIAGFGLSYNITHSLVASVSTYAHVLQGSFVKDVYATIGFNYYFET